MWSEPRPGENRLGSDMSDDRTIVEIVRDLQSDIRRLEERVNLLISGSPELGARGVIQEFARMRAEMDALRLWLLGVTLVIVPLAVAVWLHWIA